MFKCIPPQVFCLPWLDQLPQRTYVSLTHSGEDNLTPARKTRSESLCMRTLFRTMISMNHFSRHSFGIKCIFQRIRSNQILPADLFTWRTFNLIGPYCNCLQQWNHSYWDTHIQKRCATLMRWVSTSSTVATLMRPGLLLSTASSFIWGWKPWAARWTQRCCWEKRERKKIKPVRYAQYTRLCSSCSLFCLTAVYVEIFCLFIRVLKRSNQKKKTLD